MVLVWVDLNTAWISLKNASAFIEVKKVRYRTIVRIVCATALKCMKYRERIKEQWPKVDNVVCGRRDKEAAQTRR
jgi:hypothetical protein